MHNKRKKKSFLAHPADYTENNLNSLEDHGFDELHENVIPIVKIKPFILVAKTQKQKELILAIKTSEQVIVRGPAGCGKTYVTASLAALALKDKKVDKIVITRPNVSSSKSLGFLPGDKNEKFSAWAAPIIEVLKDALGKSLFDYMLKTEQIEMVPFEFMRGRSFRRSFVIVDETQSTSIEEMITLVTRIGEESKLVMLGDVRQKDIKAESGLEWAIKMVRTRKNLQNFVREIEFDLTDVVRSGSCSAWVYEIYD